MDTTAVVLSVVAFLSLLSTSLFVPLLLEKSRARTKAEEVDAFNDRADEIAARAEAVATLAAAKVEETAVRLEASTAKVAAVAAATSAVLDVKLDTIHTLVNSSLTAAKTAEERATAALVVILKRIVAEATLAGRAADPMDMEQLAANEAKLRELQALLTNRAKADREVVAAVTAVPVSDSTVKIGDTIKIGHP